MGRRRRQPLPPGFGSVWTCVAIDLVGWGIVLPILPLYAEDFTGSPVAIGLLVASFSAMQLLFAPVLGRLSDRVGRKPVLVLSLAGTAVGSLVMGLAGSLPVLFLGRILHGISGGSISAAQAAVSDMAPPDQRARLFGLLGAAFGVGFVAGPALGGLAALGGRHLPFLLAAALAAGNAVVAQRRLPETNPAHRSTAPAPLTPRWRAVRGDLGVLVLLGLVATTAFAAFEATFSLFGDRRFDLGLAAVGGLFAAVGLAQAAFQTSLVHPAVARWGELGALRAGLLLDVAGFAGLVVATRWLVLVPALLLVTAGQALLSPALSSLVAGRARPHERGAVMGVQQSAGAAARMVGPLAGTALFGHVGTGWPFVLAAGLAAAGLALTTRLQPAVSRAAEAAVPVGDRTTG